MSLSGDGLIVVLSSPSGAGKTTLVKKLSKLKNYTVSISHTTRPPRTSETNGKDYFFISKITLSPLPQCLADSPYYARCHTAWSSTECMALADSRTASWSDITCGSPQLLHQKIICYRSSRLLPRPVCRSLGPVSVRVTLRQCFLKDSQKTQK